VTEKWSFIDLGIFRPFPNVENGEFIFMMYITKCVDITKLYDAI
jgi:hypothetical protein